MTMIRESRGVNSDQTVKFWKKLYRELLHQQQRRPNLKITIWSLTLKIKQHKNKTDDWGLQERDGI